MSGATKTIAAIPNLIDHPPHYTSHPSGIECIQVTEYMSFCLGNVVKYLWRADAKGAPLSDLKKAQWYLAREIARREQEESGTPAAPHQLDGIEPLAGWHLQKFGPEGWVTTTYFVTFEEAWHAYNLACNARPEACFRVSRHMAEAS